MDLRLPSPLGDAALFSIFTSWGLWLYHRSVVFIVGRDLRIHICILILRTKVTDKKKLEEGQKISMPWVHPQARSPKCVCERLKERMVMLTALVRINESQNCVAGGSFLPLNDFYQPVSLQFLTKFLNFLNLIRTASLRSYWMNSYA